MFASIILISSFTAAITTSLIVSELSGKARDIHDLPAVRVGSMVQSRGRDFLTINGIAALSFNNDRQGWQALVNDQIDAFVYVESIRKHLVKTQLPALFQVLPDSFDRTYISMAIPPGSQLRETLNRSILKFMHTNQWRRLIKQYLGTNGM